MAVLPTIEQMREIVAAADLKAALRKHPSSEEVTSAEQARVTEDKVAAVEQEWHRVALKVLMSLSKTLDQLDSPTGELTPRERMDVLDAQSRLAGVLLRPEV